MPTYDPSLFSFDPDTGISRPQNQMDVFAQALMANPGAYKQIMEMIRGSQPAPAARPTPAPPPPDTSSGIGLPFSQFLSPRASEASPAAPAPPLGPPIPSREERVLGLMEDQNRQAGIAAREARRAEAEPFNPFAGVMEPNSYMSAPPPPGSGAPTLEITPDTIAEIEDYTKPFQPQKLWGIVDELRELDRTLSPGNQPRRAEGAEALPEGDTEAAPEPAPAAGPIAPPPEAARPKPRPAGAPATSALEMPSTATRSTGSTGNPKGLAEDAVEAEEKLNRVQQFFKNRLGIEDPETRENLALALMQGGATMMQAPGNFLEGLGAGVEAGVGGYMSEIERDRKADLEREVMDLKREEAAANRANDALRAETARAALEKAKIELEIAQRPESVFDSVSSSEGKVFADAQRISAATGVPFEVVMEQLLGIKAAGRSDPLAGLGLE